MQRRAADGVVMQYAWRAVKRILNNYFLVAMQKGLAIAERILHKAEMRNHRDILRDAGHDRIASLTGRPITTVRSWDQRDSIPSDLWLEISNAGFSSLEELATGSSRKRPEQDAAA